MSQNNRRKPIDYFTLETATKGAVKVVESSENRSLQTASGQNIYGDAAVVDSYGETSAPSATYDLIADIEHDPAVPAKTLIELGTVSTVTGVAKPVVLGTLTISTQAGQAPTISASGQMVQTGAVQLRAYKLPAFMLSARHRAQDFMGLCTIKKGGEAADGEIDYGLGSVRANFPIQITLAQPQGVVENYDLHGDMATVDYSMNWYDDTPPTVELTAAALQLGAKFSKEPDLAVSRDDYKTYAWQVAFPLTGEEVE